VREREEQQERTEICQDEIVTIMGKGALRKRLNEAMKRKSTQAE
jgi:hypothetical protein